MKKMQKHNDQKTKKKKLRGKQPNLTLRAKIEQRCLPRLDFQKINKNHYFQRPTQRVLNLQSLDSQTPPVDLHCNNQNTKRISYASPVNGETEHYRLAHMQTQSTAERLEEVGPFLTSSCLVSKLSSHSNASNHYGLQANGNGVGIQEHFTKEGTFLVVKRFCSLPFFIRLQLKKKIKIKKTKKKESPLPKESVSNCQNSKASKSTITRLYIL